MTDDERSQVSPEAERIGRIVADGLNERRVSDPELLAAVRKLNATITESNTIRKTGARDVLLNRLAILFIIVWLIAGIGCGPLAVNSTHVAQDVADIQRDVCEAVLFPPGIYFDPAEGAWYLRPLNGPFRKLNTENTEPMNDHDKQNTARRMLGLPQKLDENDPAALTKSLNAPSASGRLPTDKWAKLREHVRKIRAARDTLDACKAAAEMLADPEINAHVYNHAKAVSVKTVFKLLQENQELRESIKRKLFE